MSRHSASVRVRHHGNQNQILPVRESRIEQGSIFEGTSVVPTLSGSRTRRGVERVAAALVEGLLGDAGVRIIDVRRQPLTLTGLYAKGHLPGAIWLDVDRVLDGPRRAARSLLEFAAVMARHGVGDEHLVILYDEGKYGTAPALARAMTSFGHNTVGVLEGGWERWLAGGNPVERGERAYPPASFTAKQGWAK